jgi:hypothetical protein
MVANITAIEVEGDIDENGTLRLDEALPVPGPSRARVIVLLPNAPDVNEREWLHAAATNPDFDFLAEPAEDIYSLEDGKPFDD